MLHHFIESRSLYVSYFQKRGLGLLWNGPRPVTMKMLGPFQIIQRLYHEKQNSNSAIDDLSSS